MCHSADLCFVLFLSLDVRKLIPENYIDRQISFTDTRQTIRFLGSKTLASTNAIRKICPPLRCDVAFGHPPPAFTGPIRSTSVDYLIDHCKFLWKDYGHDFRSVRVRAVDVLLSSPFHFSCHLWPVERNTHVVRHFMRALFKYPRFGYERETG